MGPESRLAVARGWGVAADPAERRPRLGARPHGAGAVRGRRKRPHTRRGPASPPHAPPGHAPEGRRRWPRSPAPRDRLPAREDPSSRRGCRSHTPVASCRPPPCSWLPRVLAGDPPCPHPPTSVDAAEASAGALPGRVLVRGPTGAQPRASLRGRRPGGHLSGVGDRAGTGSLNLDAGEAGVWGAGGRAAPRPGRRVGAWSATSGSLPRVAAGPSHPGAHAHCRGSGQLPAAPREPNDHVGQVGARPRPQRGVRRPEGPTQHCPVHPPANHPAPGWATAVNGAA